MGLNISRIAEWIRPWCNSLLNIFYPSPCNCIVCRAVIGEETRKAGIPELPDNFITCICSRCKNEVDHIHSVGCMVCGRVYDEQGYSETVKNQRTTTNERVCQECNDHNRPFELARAAIQYKGMGKDLIRIVKFEGRREPIGLLGQWMCNTWLLYFAHIPFDFIVPVPPQPDRLHSRGFNQAYLLADIISSYTGIAILEPLIREGSIRSQASRNRRERLLTVQGEYKGIETYREALSGKYVLLIDDVFTTGATVEACTNELKGLGTHAVWVLTLAR